MGTRVEEEPPQVASRRSDRPAVVFDDQVHPDGPRAVEVRLVRRVLRRIDPWTLFRFSLVLYGCGLVVFMVAFVGMWLVANGTGSIPSIENFITQLFALKKFTFRPLQLGAATLGLGVIGVFVATLLTTVTGVLYNLIADVVGGVELTVLEEEPLEVVP